MESTGSPGPTPRRRRINPQVLEPHVAKKKLKSSKVLTDSTQVVTIPATEFVPIIRAEVGREVALSVYSYCVLVPIAQIIRESPTTFRRVVITVGEDLDVLQSMFIRHFGGVTLAVRDSFPLRGLGGRDPQMPLETLEENEHVSFEVYAAPIQESDDYFRALRQELQEALGEGVILIERQDVTLI
jgi:hypothetical protein